MSTTELAIFAIVAIAVVALGALSVRGQAGVARVAPTSLANALRSLTRGGRNMSSVLGTIIMVAVTIVLSALLYLIVTGRAGA